MPGQPSTESELTLERPLACIVDDDGAVRGALENLLLSAGIDAEAFDSAEAFLASPRAASARCLVLDLRMPGMSGGELLAVLRASGARVPVIIVTATAEDERERFLAQGVFGFLTKPFRPAQVLAMVQAALSTRLAP
jgi:FixJ family two-component response regulator